MTATVVLLGPQRFRPTLASAVQSLGIEGEIATVTAGWQEREAEDVELRDHLDARTINLLLHRRGEDVFQSDPRFAAAHRLRQERLRQLQNVYRIRLSHAKAEARELLSLAGDGWLMDPEREAALEGIRTLDAHHLERVRNVMASFEDSVRPFTRPAIARHRAELTKILERTSALAVAGGHVVVLLNRLRLFGVLELAPEKPVLAWSAGAMAVAERIVLFHDRPPQGAGHAELLGPGLGALPGVVPLPHARKRLDLGDPQRVSLFARRFEPAVCAALDEGARLDWDGRSLAFGAGTATLASDGTLAESVQA